MTIDTTGRAHKPAGSPASTGGQFAQQTAPAAAQALNAPSFSEADVEARAKAMRDIQHEIEILEGKRAAAAARLVEAKMSVAGIDHIEFSIKESVDGDYARDSHLLEQSVYGPDLWSISDSREDGLSTWENDRIITAETLEQAKSYGDAKPVTSLAEAAERTRAVRDEIRARHFAVEVDSARGLAAAVREKFPDAAGIKLRLSENYEDSSRYYIADGLVDENDEPLGGDQDAIEEYLEHQGEHDTDWMDALINISDADSFTEGEFREFLRFRVYA